MVTRKLLTPSTLAVGLSVGLLGQDATAAETLVAYKAPVAVVVPVDTQQFRRDTDAYIRTLNKQLRRALDQDLRRTLAPKIELASNELRARG